MTPKARWIPSVCSEALSKASHQSQGLDYTSLVFTDDLFRLSVFWPWGIILTYWASTQPEILWQEPPRHFLCPGVRWKVTEHFLLGLSGLDQPGKLKEWWSWNVFCSFFPPFQTWNGQFPPLVWEVCRHSCASSKARHIFSPGRSFTSVEVQAAFFPVQLGCFQSV